MSLVILFRHEEPPLGGAHPVNQLTRHGNCGFGKRRRGTEAEHGFSDGPHPVNLLTRVGNCGFGKRRRRITSAGKVTEVKWADLGAAAGAWSDQAGAGIWTNIPKDTSTWT
jgi:hypothetical protein